jgi:hypothetical protein
VASPFILIEFVSWVLDRIVLALDWFTQRSWFMEKATNLIDAIVDWYDRYCERLYPKEDAS